MPVPDAVEKPMPVPDCWYCDAEMPGIAMYNWQNGPWLILCLYYIECTALFDYAVRDRGRAKSDPDAALETLPNASVRECECRVGAPGCACLPLSCNRRRV
jgi:hypothetical protein